MNDKITQLDPVKGAPPCTEEECVMKWRTGAVCATKPVQSGPTLGDGESGTLK